VGLFGALVMNITKGSVIEKEMRTCDGGRFSGLKYEPPVGTVVTLIAFSPFPHMCFSFPFFAPGASTQAGRTMQLKMERPSPPRRGDNSVDHSGPRIGAGDDL